MFIIIDCYLVLHHKYEINVTLRYVIITPHRPYYVRRRGLLLPTEYSVVCRSVTLVSPTKTAEPIEMPFGLRTRVGIGNDVLDGDQILILPYLHTWCGLSANLRCRSETCCTRLAGNAGCKKVAKNRHLGTIAQLCRAISSQLRHVSTIGKKLVKQRYVLHMSS